MSKENTKLLEEKNIHLWFPGSPLALCSMKLVLDISKGVILAYAKWMNVQPETVWEVACDIICYDSVRNTIETLPNRVYRRLDVARNKEFGMEIPFVIKNMNTRNVEFVLKSVTTIDGQTWHNLDKTRFHMNLEQESIFNVQKSLYRQFVDNCAKRNIDHTKLILHPVFADTHWMCACGTLNWNDETVCSGCGVAREWLRRNIDQVLLKHQTDHREAQAKRVRDEAEAHAHQDMERQKAEFEQRRQQVEKDKVRQDAHRKLRAVVAFGLVVLCLVAGGFSVYQYGLPYARYVAAKNDLNKGKYDSALERFEKTKGYLDSDELYRQAVYQKALELCEQGKKKEALPYLEGILEDSEARKKYIVIVKELAEAAYSQGQYREAAELYLKLDSKDSRLEKCQQILYEQALKDWKQFRYEKACETFAFLVGYKDSAQKEKDCRLDMAESLYLDFKFREARDCLEGMDGDSKAVKRLQDWENLFIVLGDAEGEAPSVWSGEDQSCPTCGKPSQYSFAFYDDGRFRFEVQCTTEGTPQEMSGKYRIDKNTLYQQEVVAGNFQWTEMAQIVEIRSNVKGKDDMNVMMRLKNPFAPKAEITLYGHQSS